VPAPPAAPPPPAPSTGPGPSTGPPLDPLSAASSWGAGPGSPGTPLLGTALPGTTPRCLPRERESERGCRCDGGGEAINHDGRPGEGKGGCLWDGEEGGGGGGWSGRGVPENTSIRDPRFEKQHPTLPHGMCDALSGDKSRHRPRPISSCSRHNGSQKSTPSPRHMLPRALGWLGHKGGSC
jgi:hypothetical protein